MFKIVDNPHFTHKVIVQTPIDGGHREDTFRCRFKVISTEEIADFDLDTPLGTLAFLRAICMGVEDVADEAGAQIPYSDELRDQLLSISFVRLALVRTYFAAMSKARVGN